MENLAGSNNSKTIEYHAARYAFASDYVNGKKVLDVATGPGVGLNHLRSKAAVVDGCDIKENVLGYDNFFNDPIESLCGKEVYDVIVSFETIEHTISIDAVLQSYWRLLKQGGLIVISFPNNWGLTDYHYVDTGWDTVHVVRRYFQVIDVFGQNRNSCVQPRPVAENRPHWVENIIVVAQKDLCDEAAVFRRAYARHKDVHRALLKKPRIMLINSAKLLRLKIKRLFSL